MEAGGHHHGQSAVLPGTRPAPTHLCGALRPHTYIACLSHNTTQTQRDHIRGKRCAEEVHRQLERESEDIRFDHGLATACHKSVGSCGRRAPGAGACMRAAPAPALNAAQAPHASLPARRAPPLAGT